jgi:hypothetical protein
VRSRAGTGEHHVTIPAHDSLDLTRDDLVRKLFGKG